MGRCEGKVDVCVCVGWEGVKCSVSDKISLSESVQMGLIFGTYIFNFSM